LSEAPSSSLVTCGLASWQPVVDSSTLSTPEALAVVMLRSLDRSCYGAGMGRSVTLKDVALHAGVSRSTASYVVMGTGRVSAETRRRVRASMDALGYVYNQGAASLRRRTGTTVGVVVTHIDNPFFGELLVGLESTLTAAGFLSLVVTTADDPRRQDDLLKVMREHQVAGLALIPATGTGVSTLEQIRSWGVPHILMTRYLPRQTLPYVGPDDVLGGRLAAEHLVSHGCASLAYVGGRRETVSRSDRFTGAREVAERAGIDLDDVPTETSGEGGRAAAAILLERESLPDGVLCHSDTVAMGFSRALEDAGRTGEVRIIGYDNIGMAGLWIPSLTTIATGASDIGHRAATAILAGIEAGTASVESHVVTPQLVVRESCGRH
jgi:LacI family transcriptional regulator